MSSSISRISVPSGVARTPAIGSSEVGSTTLPQAFTAVTAPTWSSPSLKARAPRPLFMTWSGPSSLPTVAPVPAPTVPSANSPGSLSSAVDTAASPAATSGRAVGSPKARSKRHAEHTMGTTVGPTGKPMPRRSSSRAAPEDASSPNAEPPDSTTAFTWSTVSSGLSRSVSRDAGAPPRTSTPPVAPFGHTITVHPVSPSRSVQWPKRNPSTCATAIGASGESDIGNLLVSALDSMATNPTRRSTRRAGGARPRRWAAPPRCRSRR